MILVFVHGPAAAGKLTIGRELSRLMGIPLFHNHLVVDAVGAVFPFGTPEFVRLRHEWWLQMFQAAANDDRSLIFTFTPEPSVPKSLVEDIRGVVGGRHNTRFIQLLCGQSEQERRIENASRSEFNKLRSLEVLREIRGAEHGQTPWMPPSDFTVDTESNDPRSAAVMIREFLGQDSRR